MVKAKRGWVWAVRDGAAIFVFTQQPAPKRVNFFGIKTWRTYWGKYPSLDFCMRIARRALAGWEKIGTEPVKVRFSVDIVKEKPIRRPPKPRSEVK